MNQEIPSKGKQEDEVRTNNRKTAGPEAGGSRSGGSVGSNDILEKRVRNIQGHVEEEALWRVQNIDRARKLIQNLEIARRWVTQKLAGVKTESTKNKTQRWWKMKR
ncbi:hypothetical protein V6N11_070190 [Hibiscus sabdariffa]|uniref:Uncharacterized protein n=1 Tax=Hibiscus sabdariffa TaxID=183260 RepID=A0ABR2QEA6_9ROSI